MSAFLKAEAVARERLHENHASSRPLSDNYEFVGMSGEKEFSKFSGQPMDLERKAKGDGRIDFVVPVRMTVDVKTARKAFNLIEEVGKVEADIYVLAEYSDDTEKARFLGWEWGRILAKAPSKDFGYGIINHYIPREKLRPMSELDQRIMRLK